MEIENYDLNISFINDGLYTKECVGLQILINEEPVGAITSVGDKFVNGVIWDRYAKKIFFVDGRLAELVISNR